MNAFVQPFGRSGACSGSRPERLPEGETKPMTMQFTARSSGSSQTRCWAADRRMCRRLVTISLPFFLVAAAIRRVLPAAPRDQRAGPRPSLYAEARANAYATIPFIFMG